MMTSSGPAIISSEMPCRSLRLALCAPKLAGVACENCTEVTTPVALSSSAARSATFLTDVPDGSMPSTPLFVLTPVASAVPAAAESVAPVAIHSKSDHAFAGSYSARPLAEWVDMPTWTGNCWKTCEAVPGRCAIVPACGSTSTWA